MRIFLAIFVIAIIAASGCKKSSSTPPYNMSAYIESSVTDENFGSGDCYETSNGNAITFIGQSGATLSQPYISITIQPANNSLSLTTYNIDGVKNTAAYWPSGSSFEGASGGSVTITAIVPGKTISGNFDFVCSNGISVTQGSFTAKAL